MREGAMKGYACRTLALAGLLLVLSVVLAGTGPAYGFWCNGRIISVGDSESKVLNQCGPPAYENEWTEMVYLQTYDNNTGKTILLPKTVLIREWTYNQGPSSFMRILRIENGKVVRIDAGGYGY